MKKSCNYLKVQVKKKKKIPLSLGRQSNKQSFCSLSTLLSLHFTPCALQQANHQLAIYIWRGDNLKQVTIILSFGWKKLTKLRESRKFNCGSQNIICATSLAFELCVLINNKQHGAAESSIYISILANTSNYISNSNVKFEVFLIY